MAMVCVSWLSHSDIERRDQPPVVVYVTINIECSCSGCNLESSPNQQVRELQKKVQEQAEKIEEQAEKIGDLQREKKFWKQERQDYLSQSDPDSPDGESRADSYDRRYRSDCF